MGCRGAGAEAHGVGVQGMITPENKERAGDRQPDSRSVGCRNYLRRPSFAIIAL